ncbi:hypothetical protein FPK33_21745 [Acinetobacter baumannii]|uniref:DUF6889 family protein n=1 Tax=Acinetobacter baumannii TaxID=470 RepID=UPI0028926271|nr:hypothetical protein [Acinetobacter baumannii]MDT1857432.1 hypothetical protein [Acinetobacter baumannii]
MKFKPLPDHEDWLLRPVIRGLCRFESLKDGTLDLADIALMNDALDVQADNQLLLERYHEQNKG